MESEDYGWMKSDVGTGAKPRHPLQSWAEYRCSSAPLRSSPPLILGNECRSFILPCPEVRVCDSISCLSVQTQDPRNMSQACLDIIANKEIIALECAANLPCLSPALSEEQRHCSSQTRTRRSRVPTSFTSGQTGSGPTQAGSRPLAFGRQP